MARLKLCLFAIPALALAVVQLSWTSKHAVDATLAEAQSEASRAIGQVQRALIERHAAFSEAAFAVASSPDVVAAIPLKKSDAVPPNEKTFEALRDAVRAQLPPALRDSALIAWSDDSTSLGAVGMAPPAPGEFPKVAPGSVARVPGTPYLAASFSPRPNATVTVAVPAFDSKGLQSSAGAVAVLEHGKVVASAGPEKDAFAQALASGKPGVVRRGAAGRFLGQRLPMFAGELSGEAAPQAVLARESAGPLEIAAVVSTSEAISAIGAAQHSGLVWALVLAVLFVVALIVPLGKRAKSEGTRVAEPEQAPAESETQALTVKAPVESNLTQALTVKAAIETNPTQALTVAKPAVEPPLAMAEAPVKEASPDDFQFGASAPAPAKAPEPLAAFAPPSSSEGLASSEPSSLPIAESPSPAALLQAAAIAPVDADEQHFQEVFRDFVALRAQCGEPADGLTFEKFAPRLRKKRDELAGKNGIKTVRFQAYVKDGKAALRATAKKE